jgi:acyl-CoA synthetase (AMP-forming)/AMP-acid ligase II
MFAKLLDRLHAGPTPIVAPSLRLLYAGGSPLDLKLKTELERHLGLPLHNGYGLTEASPTITQTRLDAPRDDCSVGPALPGVAIRIVDSAGFDVARGDVGELWVRGPNVMRGYYRNADLTSRTIDVDGWLNTGDMVQQGSDGALFVVGRTKELIIRSGFNVYPAEVESVLNAHPDVTHSAVVGREVLGNEEVVAFLELTPHSAATSDAIASFAAERLAPYKRPSEIVILAALPVSATGKVLKHQLRMRARERT